ncbi:MAG: winged helix-turn-helix transcriptional regulator [Moorea sp. SIO4A1]|nr:winged helix-turn-helix transcriptional regulator [Moorena sp. SIO4A1]
MTNPFDTSKNAVGHKVIAGLAKISLALKSKAWQDAGLQGLTPTQGQILALLRSRSLSPMRLSEIADGLAVKPATASDAVAVLVEKGLVKKGKAPDDRRAIAITLTAKGQQQADNAASWPDFLLTAVDQLSEEETDVFFRGLIKMVRALQERGQIPVSKMCVTCRFFRANIYSDSDRPHHCALVDAPFGDRHLRLECPEHLAASPEACTEQWQSFSGRIIGPS